MKVIYIAGKYRAPSEWEVVQNIRAAEKAAIFIWQCGAAALCPHKNTALFGGVPDCPDEVWLKGDVEMMLRCDAVWAIGNWMDSEGASAEVAIARSNDIPVLYTREEVTDYLTKLTWRGQHESH